MNPTIKTWLARIAGFLALVQSVWAVSLLASYRLAPGETVWALFLAPGIYLAEIILLAGMAALLPWIKWKGRFAAQWALAGAFAALTLVDLWTVGYYLSPAFILVLINAAFLSPDPDPFTWRHFWITAGAGVAQFLLNLAPFIKRWLF